MFDRLATLQRVFKTLLTHHYLLQAENVFVNFAKILLVKSARQTMLATWPNDQTFFGKQISNVRPAMFDRLARA